MPNDCLIKYILLYFKYLCESNLVTYFELYSNVVFLVIFLFLNFLSPIFLKLLFSSVQSSSVAQSCPTPWDPMDCSIPGLPVHHQLPVFTQTHVHWVGDAIQSSHSLLSPLPPALCLSQHQGLFKWVSLCIRWPNYWNFSFSISPSNKYSGLIFSRIDWFDLAPRDSQEDSQSLPVVRTSCFHCHGPDSIPGWRSL